MPEDTTTTSEDSQTVEAEYLAPRIRKVRRASESELNLPAMIDVVFLLLIYFVITANFTMDEGVIITDLPEASQSPAQDPKEPLQIGLEGSYNEAWVRISLNNRPFDSFTQLQQYLIEVQNDPSRARQGIYLPDHPIRVHPSRFTRWQHVLNGFNSALRARYTDVAFPTEGPES